MNKITLTRLAVMDLGVTYARRYEGTNKITHYRVGYTHALVGVDPVQAIKDFIQAAEGPTEFTFTELPPLSTNVGGMSVEPATSVLDTEPAIKAALEKQHIKSTLMIENRLSRDLTLGEKAYNLLGKIVNPIANLINRIIVPIQHKILGVKPEDYFHLYDFHDEDTAHTQGLVIAARLAKVKVVPTLKVFERQYDRMVHPCTYLSVSYEEGDEFLADQILREDLRKYYEADMILGHLAMPTRLALADTTGSGKRPMALFCFLFVDHTKLPGYNPMTHHKGNITLEGVRTMTAEGSLTTVPELDYSKKYEIEKVEVVSTYEQNQEAYVNSYKESVPHVNEAAKKMDEKIKKLKEGK